MNKLAREQLQLWVIPTIILAINALTCITHIAQLGGVALASSWAIRTSVSILGGFCGYAVVANYLTGWSYNLGNSLLRISAILLVVTVVIMFIPISLFHTGVRRGSDLGWLLILAIVYVLLYTLMDLNSRDAAIGSVAVSIGWAVGGLAGVSAISMIF